VRLHLVGPKCQAGGPLGLRTRSAWALAWGLDTHRTHVALGLPPCVLADQAHKWGLGFCLSAGHTRGAWAAPGVSHACAPLGDT